MLTQNDAESTLLPLTVDWRLRVALGSTTTMSFCCRKHTGEWNTSLLSLRFTRYFLLPVLLPHYHYVVAASVDGHVAGLAEGVEERNPVAVYIELPRAAHFAQHREVQVFKLHGEHGVFHEVARDELILQCLCNLLARHSCYRHLSHDGEVDCAVGSHTVARHLLAVGTAGGAAHAVGSDGKVEQFGQLRVLALCHDRYLVARLHPDGCRHVDGLPAAVGGVLQVGDVLWGGARP